MESQPANDIMTPPRTGSPFTKVSSVDIPKRGGSSVIAIPAGLGVVEARLEADESYQTLKAKESVLDLQVHMLVQQQQALVAQQQKLRVLKSQQERDAKARKKMANLRAKQCQELEARRQDETDKFRALETMAIIKNVDNHPQPIPKPHKKRIQPPGAPTPSLHQHTDVPIPKMKTYPRLPGLQGSSHEDFDADTKPKTIADKTSSLSSERKAVACYAQDLTPLVTGNKPRRLKVTGPRNHQPHNEHEFSQLVYETSHKLPTWLYDGEVFSTANFSVGDVRVANLKGEGVSWTLPSLNKNRVPSLQVVATYTN
ncbi:hypothetical protein DYB35_005572 [Aphanomyces astaci]|uniref:Uncharacterized protein n=1 Tax=Aphanomyces astaci TaxID=112090 RepID=A0A3R6WHJ0_APHAT|nr:hypothetical protein DYB35_005572 [Aphanomyces astaci]